MSDSKKADAIDAALVRQLANILKETELTEIEVERGDVKIKVKREITVSAAPITYAAAPAPAPVAPAAPAAPARAGEEVKSPMVGTAYLAPAPGADAFIKPGDKVRKGQTLLIVEAMKTMNPITSPRDGVVAEIVVGDAQPVEFGEPLVVLEA